MDHSNDLDTFSAPLRSALQRSHSGLGGLGARKTPSKFGSSSRSVANRSADRFIPNRELMDMNLCRMAINQHHSIPSSSTSSSSAAASSKVIGTAAAGAAAQGTMRSAAENAYSSALVSSLLGIDPLSDPYATPSTGTGTGTGGDALALSNCKILAFRNKAPAPPEGHENTNKILYSGSFANVHTARKKTFRHIPQQPERVLDAPAMQEDFYLNLLDWGSNNVLAVALSEAVYLWNASTSAIDQLCETTLPDDYITSVAWLPDGTHLAVGTNRSKVQIWDTERKACVRTMSSHSARVGALAWNGAILTSGSRDAAIHNADTRIRDYHVATLASHTQEVCGLRWNSAGSQLASGANDNTVCIWDNQHTRSQWTPRYRFEHHTAAVKALAWCPWQTGVLATGGGSADRHLRFWNTTTGCCLNSVDTNSQVCSILWSPHERELITGHGFSQNQLTVWKYPSLARMADLTGHTSRVLHMAISPDGQTVVSGAADETLRFWRVFAKDEKSKSSRIEPNSSKDKGTHSGFMRSVHIR